MKKPPIGHVTCSICDFQDAEVKEDKNHLAYVHCPDCNTQTFTRDQRRDSMLRKRMRAVAAPAAGDPPEPAPASKATPAPTAAPKQKAAWLNTLLDNRNPA